MATLIMSPFVRRAGSILEDEEIELGKPFGVAEDIELDDLVVLVRDHE